MQEFLKGYGFPGLIIFCLAVYVMFLHKMYGKRIKTMEEKQEIDRKDFKQIAEKGFEHIKESTGVISSLKTLFEITIKKEK